MNLGIEYLLILDASHQHQQSVFQIRMKGKVLPRVGDSISVEKYADSQNAPKERVEFPQALRNICYEVTTIRTEVSLREENVALNQYKGLEEEIIVRAMPIEEDL